MSIGEIIGLGALSVTVLSINIWPWVIYRSQREVLERIHHLEYAVSCITDFDGGDHPDGGDEEPEEPSNIVAIGKRAA